MNNFSRRHPPKRSFVKPMVVAIALALPGSAALAASMDDVVKTRADQNIDQQYGRDSVYAFSIDAKPLKPEQIGSRDTNFFGTMKGYAADAWHKTANFAAAAWNKTTGLFGRHSDGTVVQLEPQPYGRAGGYVGSDRIAVLESSSALHANATAPDTVKTGESALGNSADTRAPEVAAPASEPAKMSAHDENGHTSGDRFDSADSPHGQSKHGDQSR